MLHDSSNVAWPTSSLHFTSYLTRLGLLIPATKCATRAVSNCGWGHTRNQHLEILKFQSPLLAQPFSWKTMSSHHSRNLFSSPAQIRAQPDHAPPAAMPRPVVAACSRPCSVISSCGHNTRAPAACAPTFRGYCLHIHTLRRTQTGILGKVHFYFAS